MTLARLGAAMRSMVTRGKVTQSGVGSRVVCMVTGLDGEIYPVELVHPFGMSARPVPGSDVVLLQVLGSRDHQIALAGDATGGSIADLAEGEVGLSSFGHRIVLRTDRIEITAGGSLPIAISGAGPIHVVSTGGPISATAGSASVTLAQSGAITAASASAIQLNAPSVTVNGHQVQVI